MKTDSLSNKLTLSASPVHQLPALQYSKGGGKAPIRTDRQVAGWVLT